MRIIAFLLMILILLVLNCAGPTNIKGGMGGKVDKIEYGTYAPQHLDLDETYQDLSLFLEISRPDPSTSPEKAVNHLREALRSEFADQGTILVEEADLSSVGMHIEISRFHTSKMKSKINGKKYQTFIDCQVECYNSITREEIDSDVYSVSGLGTDPTSSCEDVVNKLVRNIISDKELLRYVKLNIRTSSNYVQRRLDILAKNLLLEFRKKDISRKKELKIAFTEFKHDVQMAFSNIFQSSIQKMWPGDNYKFYTRTQLDQILDEYKLQLSGLMEVTDEVTGNLKPVDLIISGSVSGFDHQKIVEAQILNVHDGELIVSQSISLTLEQGK